MLAPMAGAGVFTAVVDFTAAGFTAVVGSTAGRFMPARSTVDFMAADFTPEGTDASRASIMVLVTGAAATGTMDGAEGATDGGGVMALLSVRIGLLWLLRLWPTLPNLVLLFGPSGLLPLHSPVQHGLADGAGRLTPGSLLRSLGLPHLTEFYRI